jgi:hypothetical protein
VAATVVRVLHAASGAETLMMVAGRLRLSCEADG